MLENRCGETITCEFVRHPQLEEFQEDWGVDGGVWRGRWMHDELRGGREPGEEKAAAIAEEYISERAKA